MNTEYQKKSFDFKKYGWISAFNPPDHSSNVVVLIYDKTNNTYNQVIGYYNYENWYVIPEQTASNCKIIAWFPIPYSPDNVFAEKN